MSLFYTLSKRHMPPFYVSTKLIQFYNIDRYCGFFFVPKNRAKWSLYRCTIEFK